MNGHQTEKATMLSGELYLASAAQLAAERKWATTFCPEYNREGAEPNQCLLAELFGYPTHAYLESLFFRDYGYNIQLGTGVYANHKLIVLDCARVSVGDRRYLGPNVVLSTAGHPIDPVVRTSRLGYAKPIRIGQNVWIGAAVSIVPGVEIGANTTVGAGRVVTRSIPANRVAVGNPCRVLRYL